MKLSAYVRNKWYLLFTGFIIFFTSGGFLLIMGVEAFVVIYVELWNLFCLTGCLLYEFYRKKRYYDKLREIYDVLDEKRYLTTMISRPDFYEGKLFYEILKEDEKYFNDKEAKQRQEMEEYKSYVEGWTHEIKTPIAVSKLILENNRSNWSLSVEEELDRIESYVEQMLYFMKSSSMEEDYRIQEVSLKEVSTDLMKKYAKLLIGKGITPSLKNLDYYVLSDVKWTEFMAGQAVSNAIKYLAGDRTPLIVLEAEDLGKMVSFSVRDNGIGIPAGDLKRVFKKGFTGENGRRYKKSTGMGLYLCKRLCDKMGVQIKVESIQGAGTAVSFIFPKAHDDPDEREYLDRASCLKTALE